MHYNDKHYLKKRFKFNSKYKIFLDSSPFYCIHEKIPQRIYDYNENAKIIFCIRNHEERLLSHINMQKERKIEIQQLNIIIDNELKSISKSVVEYNRALYIKRTMLLIKLINIFPVKFFLHIQFFSII